MKKMVLTAALFSFGLVLLLSGEAVTQDQRVQADDGTIEPLTRGPVHEAYLELYVANPHPAPIVPKLPPEPIEEQPPDQKPEGENVIWLPGYFAWDEDHADFVWVSGFWRDVPPERNWVAGYWAQVEDGGQWVSGYWTNRTQNELTYYPQPPDSIDVGPAIPAPTAESVYIPGVWVYRETRYVWRPGFWVGVRPGWVYVSARYYWTPVGYHFCDGYWDYPIHSRGVLFTPVYFHGTPWVQRDWYYQPRYVVPPTSLVTCLFARPIQNGYFFGDYFTESYTRAGYIPWVSYSVGRNTVNPLFASHRFSHDREWAADVRQTYQARYEGRAPRPPATWREQTQIIQNITTNNTVNIGKQTIRVDNSKQMTQQMTLATPLAALSKTESNVKLQAVSTEARTQAQNFSTQIRNVSQERRKMDTNLVRTEVKAGSVTRATLAVPSPVATGVKGTKTKASAVPPSPELPKSVEQKAPETKKAAAPRFETKARIERPVPPVVQPGDEKKTKKTPAFEPTDKKKTPAFEPTDKKKTPAFEPSDKKGKKTPAVDPPDEKKAKKTPAVEPLDEKKGKKKSAALSPAEETKPTKTPPTVKPADEKKVGKPPVTLPKEEEKKASKPAVNPKDEKSAVRPPPTIPKEEKELKKDQRPKGQEKKEKDEAMEDRPSNRPVIHCWSRPAPLAVGPRPRRVPQGFETSLG